MKVFKLSFLIVALLVLSCKPAKYADLEDGMYADLVTNKGDILLKLEFEKTPITVANFVSLANGTNSFVADSLKGKPFYNGTVFHRVIPNFMIQGGDPLGTGSGDPGYKFSDEFPKDEKGALLLKHTAPGILSMANSGPATNGSQFFITHKETPWLDGKHTVFGNVEIGQSVVDSIVQNDQIESVEIIKIGKAAKSFKAAEQFKTYFEELESVNKAKEERMTTLLAKTKAKFDLYASSVKELPSGLKYVITETKNGIQPKTGTNVKVNCAGYFTDGKLFWTTWKALAETYEMYDHRQESAGGYAPISTVYSDEAPLIPGFREGLQKMKLGDKALLYIPSHLGYGAAGAGGVIPPNADLVFELELVE
ncbi:Peptidyl-prolyl cis-trans isomerase (rotamase) -cyclophilin family [Lutibacter agarilyticus]|uniref:peptidylprolyl isomerase n=1 Tax=Lutibacter agarilyticus TaxID=1109740 RepID=A0A238V7N9_9FLAO|nr:peptidylprolyl isomerase [Lutibacter agarilyticus]SNR30430.1 Peptidyl-prolyl cis-trans isomerase (rotamase) -cyclophilin family [Lutibacter agarilyticus]